jgi:hypothetical protein
MARVELEGSDSQCDAIAERERDLQAGDLISMGFMVG